MNAQTETKAPHQSITAALAAAQAEMGKALKQANNPHFRSKYADLGSVSDACLPALNKHGIAVIQPTLDDETGRYVETRLIHASGESLSCRVPLIVQKNDMQGYGSAVTYARRYGLMCMAGIAPEDDDGNAAAAAAPKEQPRQRREEPTDRAVAEATQYLTGAESMDDLKQAFKNLPRVIAAMPEVIAAKDARKDALTKTATVAADLAGELSDEVPH